MHLFQTYPEWASMKNIMLSSFFWGYICFQIGAGQLAKNYGPKLFLGGTTFIGSLFCLLIPLFGKHFGYGGVIACRVVTGLSQGFIFPCVHTLLSSWAPVQDRAKISTFAYAGKWRIFWKNAYIHLYLYGTHIPIGSLSKSTYVNFLWYQK